MTKKSLCSPLFWLFAGLFCVTAYFANYHTRGREATIVIDIDPLDCPASAENETRESDVEETADALARLTREGNEAREARYRCCAQAEALESQLHETREQLGHETAERERLGRENAALKKEACACHCSKFCTCKRPCRCCR